RSPSSATLLTRWLIHVYIIWATPQVCSSVLPTVRRSHSTVYMPSERYRFETTCLQTYLSVTTGQVHSLRPSATAHPFNTLQSIYASLSQMLSNCRLNFRC